MPKQTRALPTHGRPSPVAAEETARVLYRRAQSGVRATFKDEPNLASAYYGALIEFVTGVIGPQADEPLRLLDIGCGCGWSSQLFWRAGYTTTGIDFNSDAFEPAGVAGLTFVSGDVTHLPLMSACFDVVVSYQCLEHVRDPRQALGEMGRVCRPGGVIVVVGPNLLTPLVPLRYLLTVAAWRRMKFRRRDGDPRHPYGNTLPEIVFSAAVSAWSLLLKSTNPAPSFTMREPDCHPPFHADNDACYRCTPIDLINYFSTAGYAVLQRGKHGRPSLTHLLAGGTWVAARKSRRAL